MRYSAKNELKNIGGPRKKTEEGYKIFTMDELKIGQGSGETADCPFDCKCCY